MEKNTDNKRVKRVQEAYQHELANLLLLEIRDPRLAGVWVSQVHFTPDLRLAKIYFNVPGGRLREQEALDGFERCKSFLRRELAQRIRMKFTPDLRFYFDESFEVQQRMDELFHQIETQKKHEPQEDPQDD